MHRVLTAVLDSGGHMDETTIWLVTFECNGKAWSSIREDLLEAGLITSERGRASITEAGRAFQFDCTAQLREIAEQAQDEDEYQADITSRPDEELYRLPDGRVIACDATASKGAAAILFTLADGQLVDAVRV
jgi:predicted transcriptional regulator